MYVDRESDKAPDLMRHGHKNNSNQEYFTMYGIIGSQFIIRHTMNCYYYKCLVRV